MTKIFHTYPIPYTDPILCIEGLERLIQSSFGLKYIDIDNQNANKQEDNDSEKKESNDVQKSTRLIYQKSNKGQHRRNWFVSSNLHVRSPQKPEHINEEQKDENLKNKISTLVEQTVHDTNRKVESISHIKEHLRNEGPYKAGFILSMIKKTKDVLSELFNVAVKHKNDWKALEQLKIFELIVHTNVDTTNLVRQLVEVHIQHLNTTHTDDKKKRVVLLK